MRFACIHQVSVFLPVEAAPLMPGHVPAFSKMISGELEVVVLADRRHRVLPGQRTVVRFRLVG
jgi:hypothetical protein